MRSADELEGGGEWLTADDRYYHSVVALSPQQKWVATTNVRFDFFQPYPWILLDCQDVVLLGCFLFYQQALDNTAGVRFVSVCETGGW